MRAPPAFIRAGSTALWLANHGTVLMLVWLDWLTPAGIVVGILLVIPILLTSIGDSPRRTWLTFALATTGFVLAAWLGRGPVSPRDVWLPNRVLAFMTLPAALLLALHVQARRRAAEQARDQALRVGEVNRLLLSIVAHDMRAPLVMATQAIEYVRDADGPAAARDEGLLDDVDARLRRNIDSLDGLLELFREELGGDYDPLTAARPVQTAAEIDAIVRSFTAEAEMRGKQLDVNLAGVRTTVCRIDPRVLRHAAGILLDNAIRHARPGVIEVAALVEPARLIVSVTDPGPAESPGTGGTGLGLTLCRAVAARAGGAVDVRTLADGRTDWRLTLATGE